MTCEAQIDKMVVGWGYPDSNIASVYLNKCYELGRENDRVHALAMDLSASFHEAQGIAIELRDALKAAVKVVSADDPKKEDAVIALLLAIPALTKAKKSLP